MSNLFKSKPAKLLLAFFLIYFIWGSTYLAIRYAIETIPPFLMAGTRFSLAGILLYCLMRLSGSPNPSLKQWGNLWIVGTFLFLGGNGLVVWAELHITSGIAALLVSLLPLWMITLDWLWAGGRRPTLRAIGGISLGLAGVVILLDPVEIASTDIHISGALTVILASLLWAIGSIYSKKIEQPQSIFISAACQMTGGGFSLLMVSLFLGEWPQFNLTDISLVSLSAFFYLLVFGSIIAISSYVWLLKNASAASVSTYAFVNPAVAIFLGWLIAGEEINLHIISGAVIILIGVALVITAHKTKKS
ncbi:MAG: drug/metabolite transporter (DMT)-like permease [Pseudohongiellaceae bacterium]|jgi:drug/metabolite transporter (DMT)-like permease